MRVIRCSKTGILKKNLLGTCFCDVGKLGTGLHIPNLCTNQTKPNLACAFSTMSCTDSCWELVKWHLVTDLGSQQPTIHDMYFRNSRDLDFRNTLIRNPRLCPLEQAWATSGPRPTKHFYVAREQRFKFLKLLFRF